MKKKILILAGYYLPGVKGGGPIQSTKNLVEVLKEYYDIYILANDRDLGDNEAYKNVELNKWEKINEINVFYTDLNSISFKKLLNIFNSHPFNVLYLNSVFSVKLSIIPITLTKLKILCFNKVIISPRGNFSKGALNFKSYRKKLYLLLSKFLKLYNNVSWHATAISEKKDIETVLGNNNNITIVNNLTANYENLTFEKPLKKVEGKIKIVFLSRIHPKKNLLKSLEYLRSINGLVEFNIYGPIEDETYWLECKNMIQNLPTNISVCYKGMVEHHDVINIFKNNHIFLFPTLGENFGHVISEAFIGGCPVIISDQTPWRDLDRYKVGWDLNLNDDNCFVEAIQECVDLNEKEYKILSINSFNYGKQLSMSDTEAQKYIKLFDYQ